MRIDEGIQADLWSITMGIFNLGNVSFKREGDGFASVDPKTMKFLEIMTGLWGIEPKAMVKRLTTANMKVMKKSIEKKIPFDDASTNRDSISKGIYENIFLYLCERINAELYQTDEEVCGLHIFFFEIFLWFKRDHVLSLHDFDFLRLNELEHV